MLAPPWPVPRPLFYDATKPLSRCIARERTRLFYLCSIGDEVYARPGILANSLAGRDLDSLAVNGHGQNLGASVTNGRFHAFPGVWLDKKDHAAASTRSADFARQRAIAAGVVNNAVDGLRRDRRRVSLSEGPLFAHQAAGLGAVGVF